MAETTAHDWTSITGHAVRRLKAPKITPVPEPIVRQAQRSYDGVPDEKNEGELLHVLEHDFKNDEKAAEFAKLIRKAGDHTTPLTSVSAVIDPENDGSKSVVRWRAGARRGAARSES